MSVNSRRDRIVLALLATGFLFGCGPVTKGKAPEPEVRTATPDSVAARVEADGKAFDAAFDSFQKEAQAGRTFEHDMSSTTHFLEAVMRSAPSPEARRAAAVKLAALRGFRVWLPAPTYEEIARVTPPTAVEWARDPRAVEFEAMGLTGAARAAFLEQMARTNPDRKGQAAALIVQARDARREQREADYRSLYQRLVAYKDISDISMGISFLKPDNKVSPGKTAPVFDLPVIGAEGRFSNSRLAGHYYLIDFWATWCGPCLGERAALLDVWRRHHAQGLELVSVSLDKTPEAVIDYQQRHQSTPWTNVFLPGAMDSPTAKAFDINWMGLPRMVLVDPAGKVVDVQDDMGQELIETRVAQAMASRPASTGG